MKQLQSASCMNLWDFDFPFFLASLSHVNECFACSNILFRLRRVFDFLIDILWMYSFLITGRREKRFLKYSGNACWVAVNFETLGESKKIQCQLWELPRADNI